MDDVVLTLDRKNNKLRIDIISAIDTYKATIYNVIGIDVSKVPDPPKMHRILRNSKKVGVVFDVKEIREEW